MTLKLEHWAIIAAGIAALVAAYYAYKDHAGCSCNPAPKDFTSDLYL